MTELDREMKIQRLAQRMREDEMLYKAVMNYAKAMGGYEDG